MVPHPVAGDDGAVREQDDDAAGGAGGRVHSGMVQDGGRHGALMLLLGIHAHASKIDFILNYSRDTLDISHRSWAAT